MTFVVSRPGRPWEIRESVVTPSGPRARTLATFRVLDGSVLDRAESAATRTFDRALVRRAAIRQGAPVEEATADRAARLVLAELSAGHPPPPGLRRLLVDRLQEAGPVPDLLAGDSIAEWIGASSARRGEALRDLLGLVDRLPPPGPTRGLQFPGFRPVTDGIA